MIIGILTAPATNAPPISERPDETASPPFRPMRSARKPCKREPIAAPAVKRAFAAPMMLQRINMVV